MQNDENPGAAYLRPFELDAELTRTTPDRLTLRWFAPTTRVEAFLLEGKRRQKLAEVLGGQELTFAAPPSESRAVVAVRFFGGPLNRQERVVAERLLPLEGARNFRDLGGYPARGGKSVRWGRVFRAESLASLTPGDLNWLRRTVGLKLVCDFRGTAERVAAPDKIETLSVLSLPIEPSSPSALQETLSKPRDLGAGYIQWVEERGESVYGPLLARLADTKNLPLVFHCTAGKDRTGVGAALLLGLLGVSRKNIIADYALTNLSYPTLAANMKKNPTYVAVADKMLPLLIANPDWIEATLEHIEKTYGSVESYAVKKAKLSPRQIEQLRSNLLA
jgi:protein-tyrosine phosphatase